MSLRSVCREKEDDMILMKGYEYLNILVLLSDLIYKVLQNNTNICALNEVSFGIGLNIFRNEFVTTNF